MSWYVLHSKPNKEELLYDQLCFRTIDAYYPRIKVRPVNPRARTSKPYFPGYLFIKTNQDAIGPSALSWMPGATGLVSFGNDPATVPDEFVQAIRDRVDQANSDFDDQIEKFKYGDIVEIQSGPFRGYHAIFDSHLPGRERVRILLQMLWDRQVGVEISKEMLI
jgi:transcription antitermination factor NusG